MNRGRFDRSGLNPADHGGMRVTEFMQFAKTGQGFVSGHGGQQTTRGLRVEKGIAVRQPYSGGYLRRGPYRRLGRGRT